MYELSKRNRPTHRRGDRASKSARLRGKRDRTADASSTSRSLITLIRRVSPACSIIALQQAAVACLAQNERGAEIAPSNERRGLLDDPLTSPAIVRRIETYATQGSFHLRRNDSFTGDLSCLAIPAFNSASEPEIDGGFSPGVIN
ncbi:hypothetical protein PUN28_007988 [Cardiocondyla obscurior]|uniref:Uncharacterized protein n=1 Tax=Cardiocondyla obscurior TaxID=286306 RepID=A0AAW2G0V4_9HYME